MSSLCSILLVLACFAVASTDPLKRELSEGSTLHPTCPYSCQSESRPSGSSQAELFGQRSRCFSTRRANHGSISYRCYAVSCTDAFCKDTPSWKDEQLHSCKRWFGHDCKSAVTAWGYTEAGMKSLLQNCKRSCGRCRYTIEISDGASSVCSHSDTWTSRSHIGSRYKSETWISFAGWDGQVLCERWSDVCTATGKVKPAPEQERRTKIATYLNSTFDESAAAVLLAAYDGGKFNPHMPSEGGISGKYIVDHGDVECTWARTELKHLETTAFPNLGLTAFTGVGQSELLDAIGNPCAAYVEQGVKMEKNHYSESLRATWGIDSLDGKMDHIYRRYYGGKGVRVFVLDTGIDSDHAELKGRVGQGIDFTGSPEGTHDNDGHGTHCAGTIAGTSVGVAPLAQVIPVKVLDDSGESNGTSVFQGVDYVIGQMKTVGGPMVASASLGGSRSETSNRAWKKLVDAGVIVVVAAGNENKDVARSSPASESSLMTVGAIDRNGRPASFSNFGHILDVWAPGVDVTSAKAGGGITLMSGTSMACSHVAGVAALLLERYPTWSQDQVFETVVGQCQQDVQRLKWSTGLILRTWAGPGPRGNKSSPCVLAFDSGVGGRLRLLLIIVAILFCLLTLLGCLRCGSLHCLGSYFKEFFGTWNTARSSHPATGSARSSKRGSEIGVALTSLDLQATQLANREQSIVARCVPLDGSD